MVIDRVLDVSELRCGGRQPLSYRRLICLPVILLLTLLSSCRAGSSAVTTLAQTWTPSPGTGQIVFVNNAGGQDELWSITPEGEQAQSLTNNHASGVGYHIPEYGPAKLVFASESPVALDTQLIDQVVIPEVCQQPSCPECGDDRAFDFKFSPSGRYLSFTLGEGYCGGSALWILDRHTNSCFEVPQKDRLIQWLDDERALVLLTCEGSSMSLYNLMTQYSEDLGVGVIGGWSPDGSTFWARVKSVEFGWWLSGIWAYNVATNSLIHPAARSPQDGMFFMESFEAWTPESNQLVYASRFLSYTVDSVTALPLDVTLGPRWIYVADDVSEGPRLLLGDTAFNYFIRGQEAGQLIIQRVPYEASVLPTASPPFEWQMLQECSFSGEGCPQSEYLLLDWRIGEWRLLAAEPTWTATPELQLPAPDLESSPVYCASDRSFALYAGREGVGLWRVSADGESALVFPTGQHFVYVQSE